MKEKYVGPGYATFTSEAAAAIRTLARSEGIILDPVYTGKAFAGLLDFGGNGRFTPDETLIFLHTGGLPGGSNPYLSNLVHQLFPGYTER